MQSLQCQTNHFQVTLTTGLDKPFSVSFDYDEPSFFNEINGNVFGYEGRRQIIIYFLVTMTNNFKLKSDNDKQF